MDSQIVAKDLITFDDLETTYSPDKDIFVSYVLHKDFKPTTRDYVGLYSSESCTPDQYLAFEWAPTKPRNFKFPLLRSVLFCSRYIHVEPCVEKQYQFRYVTQNRNVVGRSSFFRIYDDTNFDHESNLELVDRHIAGAGSMTVVRSNISPSTGILETYETIRDSEPEVLEVSTDINELFSNGASQSGSVHVEEPAQPFDLFRIADAIENIKHTDGSRNRGAQQSGSDGSGSSATDERREGQEETFKRYGFHEESTDGSNDSDGSAPSMHAYTVVREARRVHISEDVVAAHAPTAPRAPAAPVASYSAAAQSLQRLSEEKEKCKRLEQDVLTVKREANSLKDELKVAEQTIGKKEVIMNEMTSRIKALIHENASLTNTNNALSETMTSLHALEAERRRLSGEVDALAARLDELQSNNQTLTAAKQLREQELAEQNRRCDQLKRENDQLHDAVTSLRASDAQLQQLMTDLLYTLSRLGYTALRDRNGEVIDLTQKSGQVLEMTGSPATKCTKEGHAEKIADQALVIEDYREMCDALKQELKSWKDNVTSKDQKLSELMTQLADESNKLVAVQKQLAQMEEELLKRTESEENARRELLTASRQRVDEQQAQRERERNLRLRMRGLQESLREARIVSSITSLPPLATTSSRSSTEQHRTPSDVKRSRAPGKDSSHRSRASHVAAASLIITNVAGGSHHDRKQRHVDLEESSSSSLPVTPRDASLSSPATSRDRVSREQHRHSNGAAAGSKRSKQHAAPVSRDQQTADASRDDEPDTRRRKRGHSRRRKSRAGAHVSDAQSPRATRHVQSKKFRDSPLASGVGVTECAGLRSYLSKTAARTSGRSHSDVTSRRPTDTDPATAPRHPCETAQLDCIGARAEKSSSKTDGADPRVDDGTQYTVVNHRYSYSQRHVKPGTAVKIEESTCSRCGLVFPPNTPQSRLDKHKRMHQKFGY